MLRILLGLLALFIFIAVLVWAYKKFVTVKKNETFVAVATGKTVPCASPVAVASRMPTPVPPPMPPIDKILNDAKLVALNKQFPIDQRLDAVRVILQRLQDPEERDYYFRFLIRIAQESPRLNERANAIDILGYYNHPFTPRLLERLRRAEEQENEMKIEQLLFLSQGVPQFGQRPRRTRPGTPRPRHIPLGVPLHPFLTDEEFMRQLDQYLRITGETKRARRTVYEDSQNVHNTTLNNTMLTAVQQLVERYPSNEVKYPDLSSLSPKDREKAESSVERILHSSERYGEYTLGQVYNSLCRCIEESPHKQDMWNTLIEELVRMSGKCNTGHIARLVTVLAGYDTPIVSSTLSIDDEIYATFSHGLNKELAQPERSHLLEQLDEKEKPELVAFVDSYIQKELSNFQRDYSQVADISKIQTSLDKAKRKYLGLGD